MQRILVTGAGGFFGRHLVQSLLTQGASVFGATRDNADLLNVREVENLFSGVVPTMVYHLAARCGGIGANESAPVEFLRDNLRIGLNVLEAAHRARVKKVVIASTVCAYPKYTHAPFLESDLWSGYPEETNAPYGIAKRTLGVLADAYRQQYGDHFVTALIANLYGTEDNFDPTTSHVIPAIIRKFVDAKARSARLVTLWGDGTPTRDFFYVDDAASALIQVGERYDDPGPINLGTGQATSISELASIIAELVGYDGDVAWDRARPNGQPRRVLDVSRSRALGITSTTDLRVGLANTVRWYQSTRR